MGDYSVGYVGIDTAKLRNAVAIAEDGRAGEVRFLGEIENTEAATINLVKKLASRYRSLTFCYEAGPTGYELYRLIKRLGHDCIVAAPSLIPRKPGDRVAEAGGGGSDQEGTNDEAQSDTRSGRRQSCAPEKVRALPSIRRCKKTMPRLYRCQRCGVDG